MHYALTIVILSKIVGPSADDIRVVRPVLATAEECVQMHDWQMDIAAAAPAGSAIYVGSCTDTSDAVTSP